MMRFKDSWPDELKENIEERVAAILNGAQRWNELLDSVLERAGQVATLTYSQKRLANEKQFAEDEGRVFKDALRKLVDNWVNSGRGKDGTDDPWSRVVPVKELDDFWLDNPPVVFAEDDGRLRFRVGSHFRLGDNSAWARNLATSYFVRLLDSAERERLSVCMGCGRYFVRKRRPKKDAVIKLGSWCPNHRDQRKMQSVNAARKRRKEKLEQLAARFSSQHDREALREVWSEWIERMLNREILRHPKRYCGPPVTGNWVTRHKGAIEREVEMQRQLSADDLDAD